MSSPTPAPSPDAVAPADAAHRPSPVDTAEESVAGEEDPGASLDIDEMTIDPGSATPGRQAARPPR